MDAGRVVEEPPGGVNHHVAAGHQIVALRHHGDSVSLNPAVGLYEAVEFLGCNQALVYARVVLALDGQNLQQLPPFGASLNYEISEALMQIVP